MILAPSVLLSAALIAALPAQAQDAEVDAPPSVITFGGPESLSIETTGGRHDFTVELAETPEQQIRGLMYRESLDSNAGILFHYPVPRPTAMHMANVAFPLDMLFLDDTGEVIKIIAYAQPGSRRVLNADFTVAAVLEIPGGRAVELEIQPGDRVHHRFFEAIESAAESDETAPGSEEVPD